MLKLRLLLLFFLVVFGVILVKLFYLQVLNTRTYSTDYLTTQKIYPQRGKILDRNSQPLVVNQAVYKLFAEPYIIDNKDSVIETLDKLLHIGEATLEARIKNDKQWIAVQSNLSKDQRDLVLKQKIRGLGFDEAYKRFYPESSISAHLVGFVGKNNQGEDTGYFGVEGYYEKELAGLPGLVQSERDLANRPILFGTQERVDPEDGRDLVLTIDKAVQNIVKQKLIKAMDQYQAKKGCVIVADPYTGELLSLVCLPDFDPDKYYQYSDAIFKNEAISNVYEPGSTFKPLVVAAALQEKAIKPNDIINEKGPVSIGEYDIRTWDNEYEGNISITRILEKSSNVGMVAIGQKMGNKKVYDYIQKYGFGDSTGIDLEGETDSYLKPKNQWYPIDYATATFGQGIAVTPIQMITAFSSLVNGGYLMQPYVVKTIKAGSKEQTRDPKQVRRVISKNTSDIIKKMLVSTVEHGEYKWALPDGYTIGGKTGTAQIPVSGQYDPSKTIASFIGFAPADKPKFIALVVLNQPGTSIYGSETAAPLFFDIAKDLLNYYNVLPDKK